MAVRSCLDMEDSGQKSKLWIHQRGQYYGESAAKGGFPFARRAVCLFYPGESPVVKV